MIQSKVNKPSKLIPDRIFWIILLFYSNPGGIQQALNIRELGGGLNANDFLFALLSIVYLLTPGNRISSLKGYNKKIIGYSIMYGLYIILIFGIVTPLIKGLNVSVLFNIIKVRYIGYNIALVIYCYKFFCRSYLVFFRFFLFTSFIIIILFLQFFLSGIQVLPTLIIPRRFIDLDRFMLFSYGLMPLLIPIGSVVLLGKYKYGNKGFIVLLYALMIIIWLVSITRRHIVGIIFYLILAFLLIDYLSEKRFINFRKIVKFVAVILVLISLVALITPKYTQTTILALKETIYVLKYGETSTGEEDERLGFSRGFILEKFRENKMFGTGYTQKWQTSDEEGFESFDYPLLSAFAMVGLIGIIVFTPIYYLLLRSLIFDLNTIRRYKLEKQSREYFILLFFLLFFVYNFLQYFNWYSPVSVYTDYTWYVCLGMYLAARKNYYDKCNLITKRTD